MRRAALSVATLLVAASPSQALAKGGPVALGSPVELSLRIGTLENEILDDQVGGGAYDLSGGATLFRVRGGAYQGPTHYGHPFGIEGGMTLGWISRDAFVVADDSGESTGPTPTWGRLHLDMDLALVVDVVQVPPDSLLPPGRLVFLGGFGLSTDFAYFFMGGRLAGKLAGLQGEIEYQHRWGESHSSPNQREERIHVMGYYRSFGLGVEVWHGYSEDGGGLAATDRVFKGGYQMVTVNLAWVPL